LFGRECERSSRKGFVVALARYSCPFPARAKKQKVRALARLLAQEGYRWRTGADLFYVCARFARAASYTLPRSLRYKGGSYTVSLEEMGAEVQRSAQSAAEVATILLTALNVAATEMLGSVSAVKKLFDPCSVLTKVRRLSAASLHFFLPN
jgi:hypothetical protein